MNDRPTNTDPSTLSFEQALAELEGIVQQLEQGQLELDAAIQAYARGTELRSHCERKLKDAELKVQRITTAADGSVGVQDSGVDGDLTY